MQMFAQKFLISVVLLGFCCAVPASATLVTCTTTSCFATDPTAEDDTFQDIAVTQGGLGDSYTDLATGTDFSDPGSMLGVTSPSGAPSGTTGISAFTGEHTITITIASSANAIDFYVGGSNVYVSVTDNSGGSDTGSSALAVADGFFGVVTDSDFATFSISGSGLTIGGISIGSPADGGGDPSPTPEAATLLLVATGLFLMGYFRRRMPRRAAAQAARRGTVRTMLTGITPA